MKQCNTCKQWKSLVEFNKNKTKPDGHQYLCKDCERIYKKQYYEKNKEKHIAGVKKNKKRKKKYIDNIRKNSKCSLCGEDRWWILTFHHREEDEKLLCVSQTYNHYSIEKIQKEIDKCNILCYNCHMDIHFKPKS